MSNIYEIIDSTGLEEAQANKLKINLMKNHDVKEELFSALKSSYQTKESKMSLLKDFIKNISDDHQ
ncbi:191_t:CDS:2, partial [Funneliformis geosporum]